MPTVVISTPATAGPTRRADWKFAELRLTAFCSWSGPTISDTKDCRAGLSTTVAMPTAKAATYTCHTWTCPESVSTASASPVTAIDVCVRNSSRRFGNRSTSTPPYNPNSSIGRNCSAIVTPTAVDDPARLSTSQSCAIRCIQVPMFDTTWPRKNSR